MIWGHRPPGRGTATYKAVRQVCACWDGDGANIQMLKVWQGWGGAPSPSILPGLASSSCDPFNHQKPQAEKDPAFGLTLCCHHSEIPNSSGKRGSHMEFCTRLHKLHSLLLATPSMEDPQEQCLYCWGKCSPLCPVFKTLSSPLIRR